MARDHFPSVLAPLIVFPSGIVLRDKMDSRSLSLWVAEPSDGSWLNFRELRLLNQLRHNRLDLEKSQAATPVDDAPDGITECVVLHGVPKTESVDFRHVGVQHVLLPGDVEPRVVDTQSNAEDRSVKQSELGLLGVPLVDGSQAVVEALDDFDASCRASEAEVLPESLIPRLDELNKEERKDEFFLVGYHVVLHREHFGSEVREWECISAIISVEHIRNRGPDFIPSPPAWNEISIHGHPGAARENGIPRAISENSLEMVFR